ncbi:cytochrome c3 family protein [Desulforhopalus sp. IMCC35007]|uniref:cytochrome c3 family protein n=1 Tax=Desulforhopalus sp. IMCC35007 TaxID=2569543 RepID=UPI0010AEE61D|nr:cytochrome c3 family protein [Desulforhopalus sp. IMCC35007]TKB11377.1 hypothetical protein FCL48_05070 [Desulforhopalus sp. IMCC35007]
MGCCRRNKIIFAGFTLVFLIGPTTASGALKPETPIAAVEVLAPCHDCHQDYYTKAHYEGINPFLDPLVGKWPGSADKDQHDVRPTCLDCHTPHDSSPGKGNEKYLLTQQYLQLAALSRSINPHWRDVMCISCHKQATPTRENPALLYDGDINTICNRCHHSAFAMPEMHPVGITPSKNTHVPAEMPLREGRLTCETCHKSSLQENALNKVSVGRQNPYFLRKSELSRDEFCFVCHVFESYRRLNPHKQLDDQGKIIEGSCLFCHAYRPDVSLFGPKNVSFIVVDPNVYCVGCHPGFEQKHPAGGSHLVKPSEVILQALSTSVERIGVELPLYNGLIGCSTCHNPHEEGVIKISAAAQGGQRKNKLRLMPGIIQCTGCHWDK